MALSQVSRQNQSHWWAYRLQSRLVFPCRDWQNHLLLREGIQILNTCFGQNQIFMQNRRSTKPDWLVYFDGVLKELNLVNDKLPKIKSHLVAGLPQWCRIVIFFSYQLWLRILSKWIFWTSKTIKRTWCIAIRGEDIQVLKAGWWTDLHF